MAMFLLITYIVIFYISNNTICDNHSQENKKTLADIVFGRTNSAAYIHRTDDLL